LKACPFTIPIPLPDTPVGEDDALRPKTNTGFECDAIVTVVVACANAILESTIASNNNAHNVIPTIIVDVDETLQFSTIISITSLVRIL
jgi:hypothetical protein